MMRHTTSLLLASLAIVAGCGNTASTTDDTSSVSPTSPSAPAVPSTTMEADRAVPAELLRIFCTLDGVATNASAIVRLRVDNSVPLRTSIQSNQYEGFMTRTTFDVVWSDPSADIVTATVTEVIAARDNDPRGDAAPELGSITLVQQLQGSFLPELWESGDTVVAAVGEWGVDGVPAWRLHAAATEAADGSLSFSEPCQQGLGDDLVAVAAYRNTQPTLALLTRLVLDQLQPGASADVRAATDGFEWGDGTQSIPPSMVGRVRVSGVVYVPLDAGPGVLFITSGLYGGAGASTQASNGPFAQPILVMDGFPVELHLDVSGAAFSIRDSPVVASIDSSAIGSEQAIVAEFDSTAGIASLRVVNADEFSSLSGLSPDSIAAFRQRYEASLVADQSVAQPEFYGEWPVQY